MFQVIRFCCSVFSPLISLDKSSLALCMFALRNQLWTVCITWIHTSTVLPVKLVIKTYYEVSLFLVKYIFFFYVTKAILSPAMLVKMGIYTIHTSTQMDSYRSLDNSKMYNLMNFMLINKLILMLTLIYSISLFKYQFDLNLNIPVEHMVHIIYSDNH